MTISNQTPNGHTREVNGTRVVVYQLESDGLSVDESMSGQAGEPLPSPRLSMHLSTRQKLVDRPVVMAAAIASLGLLVNLGSSPAVAQVHTDMQATDGPSIEQIDQFQPIPQPLWMKGLVTVSGLGLIGLELWWFLFNKPNRANS